MTITGNDTCNALDSDGTNNGADLDLISSHESLLDQARELGLRPVRAFVPDTNVKQRSRNAERVAKHRAKAAADGKKSLHLLVDEDTARTLREVLVIMQQRQLPAEAALQAEFEEKYAARLCESIEADYAYELSLAAMVQELSGWRKAVAKWIGLPVDGR